MFGDNKQPEKVHIHHFEISRISDETQEYITGGTGIFYKKVGYAICTECGLIVKQDL